jgi:hypothetical protein
MKRPILSLSLYEKNKLIITSLGKTVCEFLISHFPRLFSYEYTKQMENDLDDIACKSDSSPGPLEKLKKVCDACCREIGENIQKYNQLVFKSTERELTGSPMETDLTDDLIEVFIYAITNIWYLTQMGEIPDDDYNGMVIYRRP